MSEAANQIFKKAKERVYRIVPLTASKASSVQRKKTTPIGINKIHILTGGKANLRYFSLLRIAGGSVFERGN